MTSQPDTPPTNESEAMSLRALLILERTSPDELTDLEKARLYAMRLPKPTVPLEVSLKHAVVLVESLITKLPWYLRPIARLRVWMLRRKVDKLAARHHSSTAPEAAADDHA